MEFREVFRYVSLALLPALVLNSLLVLAEDEQPHHMLPDLRPAGVGVVKSDIPFIKCEVCKKMASELISQLADLRKKATPAKPVGELQIIELAEELCDRQRKEGDWILRQDMVEEGDRIKLEEYEYDGDCRSECRTIQRACEDVMGLHDTEVAEFLLKRGLTQESLEEYLCRGISDACAAPPPPVPKTRKPGEKFEKPKPPDYSKLKEEHGLPDSVFHDTTDFKMPEGLPQIPPPKHLLKKKEAEERMRRKAEEKAKRKKMETAAAEAEAVVEAEEAKEAAAKGDDVSTPDPTAAAAAAAGRDHTEL